MRGKNMAKYKFSNKLMFALVMQDEEICAEFIQPLFPGKTVKSITFPNDIQITPEKTIVTGVLSKSVRLDVLFEGEAEVYDIEMQVETVILIILIPGRAADQQSCPPAARGRYIDRMPVKTGCTWNT